MVAWLDAMRRRDLTAVEELLEPAVVWRGLPADAVCHDRNDVLNMLRADELHEGLRSIDALELVAGDGAVVLGVRSIQDHARRDHALRAAGAQEPGWA